MDDRLWAGILLWHVTSHPGQLSLLPSAGREISTCQSAEMLCVWGVKAGWLISLWLNVWVAGKAV